MAPPKVKVAEHPGTSGTYGAPEVQAEVKSPHPGAGGGDSFRCVRAASFERQVFGNSKVSNSNKEFSISWDNVNPWVFVKQESTGSVALVPFSNITSMMVEQ